MEDLAPVSSLSFSHRDLLTVGYLPPRQSVEYNHRILAWTLTLGLDHPEPSSLSCEATENEDSQRQPLREELRPRQPYKEAMEPEPQNNEDALRRQITQMQEQIQIIQRALSSSTPSILTPSDTQTTAHYRPKPILPNPPKFNGDRRMYEAWKLETLTKIQADAASIGTPANQFAYINSRLEGAAQQMCLAYVQLTSWTEQATPEGFFAYLDQSYADPNRKMRATDRLRTMKQGDSTFASFLPRFERALADAGASTWADEAKIAFLGGALNQEIRRALVGHTTPAFYGEYVRKLIEMDGQLQTLRRTPSQRQPKISGNMDWEPTQTVQAYPTQSQAYLSSEDRDKCMREGRCFRCKEKGHRSAECQQKTQSHTRTKKHVSVTRTEMKEESESDTDHHSEVSSTVSLN
jgi:hypothetical protein